MKIKALDIRSPESYDHWDTPYKGTVQLVSEGSQSTFTLSAMAILKIFEVIQYETSEKAKMEAKKVSKAFEEVQSEGRLLEHNGDLKEIHF